MSDKKDITTAVDELVRRLKTRELQGSRRVAVETAYLLRNVVSQTKWNDMNTLMNTIRNIGRRLVQAQVYELAVGNIVKRILKITRDVFSGRDFQNMTSTSSLTDGGLRGTHLEFSLYSLLDPLQKLDVSGKLDIKAAIIEAINEDVMAELMECHSSIASFALEHIHSNEIIMTHGKSATVEAFLKSAARKRHFQVMVAETSPSFEGQIMAINLAKEGINVTVISDSAIYAIMSRVNKVILGTHAITSNGGLIAPCVSHLMAMAAKEHKVPVVICAGFYKLSPLYRVDEDDFSNLMSPNQVLNYADGHFISCVNIQHPVFAYIAPDYVSLFITNLGNIPTSYIYYHLSEFYHPDDYLL
jgi:translation initiation factor eIF-2B subunit beta